MKLKKLFLTAATLVCTCICLCSSVWAVDINDERFRDKTWDEVMEQFLADHNVDAGQVTAGYYNTVTEEEHYLNKDQLMYGASVTKLPTNMLYAERVFNGEMTMDTKIRGSKYSNLQQLSLINSDNPAMEAMVRDLGGGSYAKFKEKIFPYLGTDGTNEDNLFLTRNYLSAAHVMHALKLLYTDVDRYPGVFNCLLLAYPGEFFEGNQPEFDVAHKYGWYTVNGVQYLNDCGVAFTDDPILLVMFTGTDTNNSFLGRALLADYCSLMCDYAQYHRTLRYIEAAQESTDLTLPTTLTFLTGESTIDTPEGYETWQLAFLGVGCAVLIMGLVLLVKKKFIALVAIALSVGLMVVGAAPTELAKKAIEDGSAKKTVTEFSESFIQKERGANLLSYGTEGHTPETTTDLSALILEKTISSFRLDAGKAVRAGNYITIPVTATKVDLDAVAEDLQELWTSSLHTQVTEASVSVLFGEAGVFIPDVADAALQTAIDTLFAQWDNYLFTEDATVHLALTLDGWKILSDKTFLSLVNYA